MQLGQQIKSRLDQSFKLTLDLVMHIDETCMSLDLPGLPSNQISGQLWCIIGTRESYITAIELGRWNGFS